MGISPYRPDPCEDCEKDIETIKEKINKLLKTWEDNFKKSEDEGNEMAKLVSHCCASTVREVISIIEDIQG
jgi:flagellar motility protein MotE (MotC chaperone)